MKSVRSKTNTKARKKIWEHGDFHCPIVGTCLSLKDLEKIVRKTGLVLPENASEFEIHNIFVRLCMDPGPVSRAVNKLLDRKYQNALRRFSKAGDDESVDRMWSDSLEKGDVPGPFWAVMSHPEASDVLRMKVFGEVHMLSHLVGKSNRTDIRRLASMQKERDQAEARFAAARNAFRVRVADLTTENKILRDELERERRVAPAVEADVNSPADIIEEETDRMRRHFEDRESALLKENRVLRRENESLQDRIVRLEGLLDELGAERASLESMLEAALDENEPAQCRDRGTDRCPGPSLCGKRILYVGGRTGMIRHYRDVVEKYGGQFLHHDGGMEEGPNRLYRMLPGADAVVCPVDCVSHDACNRVKNVCRNSMKPLVLMRSSGLAALARSLGALSDQSGSAGSVGSVGSVGPTH